MKKFGTLICLVGIILLSIALSSLSMAGTLTVWAPAWENPESPTLIGWGFKYALQKFRELHPDIQVKWEVQVAGAGVTPTDMQKLMTAVAAGTGPDVTILNRFMTVEWAARGAIQPLDQFFKKDSIVFDKTVYYPGAWEASFYEDKLYTIPNNGDNVGYWSLYYNRTLFKEAGLDPNKPPTTWSKLTEYAEKLTKTDAEGRIIQLGYRPYPDWTGEAQGYVRTIKLKYPFTSEDGKTATLNAPHVIQTLEFIKKNIDAQGGIEKVSRFLSGIQPGALEPFLNNKVGMYHMGEWFLWDTAQYAPKLDFGVTFLPTPTGKNFAAWTAGWSWAIPKGAKNTKDAAVLLEFLASKDFADAFIKGALAYGKEMKRLVVLPGALYFVYNDLASRYNLPAVMRESPSTYKALRHFMTAKERAKSVHLEATIGASEIWASVTRAIEAMLYKNIPPKQALDEENIKIQKVLDEFYKK